MIDFILVSFFCLLIVHVQRYVLHLIAFNGTHKTTLSLSLYLSLPPSLSIDSSGEGIGPSQRPIPDKINLLTSVPPVGFELTMKRAAADLRLRPRRHWDRLLILSTFGTPLVKEWMISQLRRRYWMWYCCGEERSTDTAQLSCCWWCWCSNY